MEGEWRHMNAHKAYYDMLHFVTDAQQGIPKLCSCGSIKKENVDEEDTYDSLGKDISSAKTTRMTGCISSNHGLWVCNTRLRGSKYGFTTMRTFRESAKNLR
ncbi:unnamed protein product [Eruca vesicaria subsp. sativa]|uniref:Uncharacterized protein n=1 Tax=Eruca vesicaria subsp. sativa TaxID=29727 RepID=A0ABC8L580_ERUVS|nr:unnamed protein product [Eruca vesicaria subsp. sativa]